MAHSRAVDRLRKELSQEFAVLYPTTSNATLMERYNVSRATIHRLARELELKKASAYRTEVQRQNATGRILSATVREHLRQKAIGRKHTDETKRKIVQTKLRYEVANGLTLCHQCHMHLHGKDRSPREQVRCACGCGTMINPFDPYGRPRRYVNHHGRRGEKQTELVKQALREQRAGKKLTVHHRANIAAGLRNSSKRVGRPSRSSK